MLKGSGAHAHISSLLKLVCVSQEIIECFLCRFIIRVLAVLQMGYPRYITL